MVNVELSSHLWLFYLKPDVTEIFIGYHSPQRISKPNITLEMEKHTMKMQWLIS